MNVSPCIMNWQNLAERPIFAIVFIGIWAFRCDFDGNFTKLRREAGKLRDFHVESTKKVLNCKAFSEKSEAAAMVDTLFVAGDQHQVENWN